MKKGTKNKRTLFPSPYLWSVILILVLFFSLFVTNNSDLLSYRFEKSSIDLYLRSQDIPRDYHIDKVFLSDSDIHISAGYLYAQGADPTYYNFQHPPLIKYLYGFSIIFFQNPYYVQIFFAIIYLLTAHWFFLKISKNNYALSLTAAMLLAADPLLTSLSSQALLDLGQASLSMIYFASILIFPTNYWLHGISLGLFAASKFWAAPVFFVTLLVVYQVLTKKFRIKNYILHLIIASLIFSLTYMKAFIVRGGQFNIIHYQLMTFKYWLTNSVSSIPMASLVLFVTGFFKTWWGNKDLAFSSVWSPFWPVGLIVSAFATRTAYFLKEKEVLILVLVPLLYLLFLGVQAPFSRYFIMILPYIYFSISYLLFKSIKT